MLPFLLLLLSPFSCKLFFQLGSKSVPSYTSEDHKSDDAFFADEQFVAIADGVGSWKSAGVDTGLYPKRLVELAKEFFVLDLKFAQNPKELMLKVEEANNVHGSATFLIGAIDQNSGKLNIAHLGDTMFMVFRPDDKDPKKMELLQKNKPQVHLFNFPYQMGTDGDGARHAKLTEIPLKEKDLVIFSTNAIFDNLFDEKIIEIIQVHHRQTGNPQNIAEALVDFAYGVSQDLKADTPFQKESRKRNMYYSGGKPDDMTVVAAYVRRN